METNQNCSLENKICSINENIQFHSKFLQKSEKQQYCEKKVQFL